MSLKKSAQILTIATSLLLSACATSTSWTDEQKAKLTDLRIEASTFGENSYNKPNAKDSHLFENNEAALRNSGHYGGGGLVSLALLAVDGAVVAVQQTKYDSKNEQYYEAVKKQINDQSDAKLTEKLTTAIQLNPFFSNKISADSKNVFKLNINSHGLARTANTKVEDMKMFYGIKGYASLVNRDGEEMLGKTYIGRSYTTATMFELMANDFSILNKMKNEAQDSLTNSLKNSLLDKTTSQAEKDARALKNKELLEKKQAEQKAKKETAPETVVDTTKP